MKWGEDAIFGSSRRSDGLSPVAGLKRPPAYCLACGHKLSERDESLPYWEGVKEERHFKTCRKLAIITQVMEMRRSRDH